MQIGWHRNPESSQGNRKYFGRCSAAGGAWLFPAKRRKSCEAQNAERKGEKAETLKN
jgi:hypothetical protein